MNLILFDIDGTLILSGGAGREALDAALRDTFEKTGSEAVDVNGRTDRGIASSLFRHHGVEDSNENWIRFRTAYLAALPGMLAARRGRVLDGVAKLITALGQVERTAIGLLTGNVREGARIKLSHFSLAAHFEFGGFGDDHHDRDDVAREALVQARSHLGYAVPPERVWVVGDTPHDIRCARAIGAMVAAVGTGEFTARELSAHAPDLTLDDLSDTDRLVRCFTREP